MNQEMEKVTVEEYIKRVENGDISLALSIQRGDGQWSLAQQSLLVDSVLKGYPVPSICTVSHKGAQVVVDGLQRTTAIRGFYKGEYALEVADKSLRGKTFSELDEQYKQKFREYGLNLISVTEVGYEELAQIFWRLNNGTALTKTQKTRGVLGDLVANWTSEMCRQPLFTEQASFTKRQLDEDAPLECLLQGILLIHGCLGDSNGERYPWENISKDEVHKYGNEILSKASEEELNSYRKVIEYAGVGEVDKRYEKTFVSVVILLAKYAMMAKLPKERFKDYIERKSNKKPAGYAQYKGAGCVFKPKTIGRIKSMIDDFNETFKDVKKPQINLDASRKKPVTEAAEKTVDKKGDVKSDDNVRLEDRAEVEAAVDVLAEAMEMSVEADTSVTSEANEKAAGDASMQTEEVICQEKDLDMTEATDEAGSSVSPETNEEVVGEDSTEAKEGICQEGD